MADVVESVLAKLMQLVCDEFWDVIFGGTSNALVFLARQLREKDEQLRSYLEEKLSSWVVVLPNSLDKVRLNWCRKKEN